MYTPDFCSDFLTFKMFFFRGRSICSHVPKWISRSFPHSSSPLTHPFFEYSWPRVKRLYPRWHGQRRWIRLSSMTPIVLPCVGFGSSSSLLCRYSHRPDPYTVSKPDVIVFTLTVVHALTWPCATYATVLGLILIRTTAVASSIGNLFSFCSFLKLTALFHVTDD